MYRKCAWGSCNSDSRYAQYGKQPRPDMHGVTFFNFPRPYLKNPRCRAWVLSCGRKDFKIKDVRNTSYVCSKHFYDGKPTRDHPLPEPALPYTEDQEPLETTHDESSQDCNSKYELEKRDEEETEPPDKRRKILCSSTELGNIDSGSGLSQDGTGNARIDSKKTKPSPAIEMKFGKKLNRPSSSHMAAFKKDLAQTKKIEFGLAPRQVAYAFQADYEKYGSMTYCIKNALSKAPFLTRKYRFIDQSNDNQLCLMTGFISNQDNLSELRIQLYLLDKYVKDNHLRTRASAIEELLFSQMTQHPLQTSNSQAINGTTMKAAEQEKLTVQTFTPPSEDLQHFSERDFYCLKCRKKFMSREMLRLHLRSEHKTLVPQKEPDNSHDEPESGHPIDYAFLLLQSFQSKFSVDKKCFICGLKLKDWQVTSRHCWTHAADFNFSCSWCGFMFQNPEKMQSHILKKSCMSLELILQKYGSSLAATDDKLIKIRANQDFTGVFPKHFKPYVVAGKGLRFLTFKCMFCTFFSKQVAETIAHAREHVQDYPYRCMKCKYATSTKEKVKEHENQTSHREYVFIQRADPLTPKELEILENMKMKMHENKNGSETGLKNSVSAVVCKIENDGAMIAVPDGSGEEIHAESAAESTTNATTWFFCEHCDSAFLVKKNYNDHLNTCKNKPTLESVETGDAPNDVTIEGSEALAEDVPIAKKSFPTAVIAGSDGSNAKQDKLLLLQKRLESVIAGLTSSASSSPPSPLIFDHSTVAVGTVLELNEPTKTTSSETSQTCDIKSDVAASNVAFHEPKNDNSQIDSCPEKIFKVEKADSSPFFPC